MNTGHAIKLIRTEKGISQQELSKLIYEDASRVKLLETGKRMPNTETLQKLAKALNVSIFTILFFSMQVDGELINLPRLFRNELHRLAQEEIVK